MLAKIKFIQQFKNLRLVVKLLVQGAALTILLTIVQLALDGYRDGFMSYMPPIGFALLMFVTYIVQPLLVGVLNIFIINFLYNTKGWQVGFWLNGIFLLLTFSTINVVMQTALGLPFSVAAAIDIVVLALPFGCIARFSNGGWKKPID